MPDVSRTQFRNIDLSGRTPADIDKDWWPVAQRHEQATESLSRMQKFYGNKPASWAKQVEQDLSPLREKVTDLKTQLGPYEEEFQRRGGWRRHFIVTNADGHVHKSEGCPTLHPGRTQVAYMPELSGLDDDAVVSKVGHVACTVCFPKAPTNPTFIRTQAEADTKVASKKAAQCEGSGTFAKSADIPKDYFRYAVKRQVKCPTCGGATTLTDTGKYRAHKKP